MPIVIEWLIVLHCIAIMSLLHDKVLTFTHLLQDILGAPASPGRQDPLQEQASLVKFNFGLLCRFKVQGSWI
jgi:hypothetical protein